MLTFGRIFQSKILQSCAYISSNSQLTKCYQEQDADYARVDIFFKEFTASEFPCRLYTSVDYAWAGGVGAGVTVYTYNVACSGGVA